MPRHECTQDGVVTIFPTKINANFKAKTVDEIINLKKQMPLASFKYMIDEIRAVLDEEARLISVERLNMDISRRYDYGIYSLTLLKNRVVANAWKYLMLTIALVLKSTLTKMLFKAW
jgi:hypothetical protein